LAEKFCVSRKGKKLEIPRICLQTLKETEKRKGIEQAKVAIGFHFPRISDKERYTAQVFSTILGQGMSSKLFTEVREKRGLAYAVRTSLDTGDDYGYLMIYIGTDKDKVDEVTKISIDEFRKMRELSEAELEEGKKQVIGNYDVGAEGSDNVALNLILEEITGRAGNYYKFKKNIEGVSLADITKLAEKTKYGYFALIP